VGLGLGRFEVVRLSPHWGAWHNLNSIPRLKDSATLPSSNSSDAHQPPGRTFSTIMTAVLPTEEWTEELSLRPTLAPGFP
jgi:hypothetical protein